MGAALRHEVAPEIPDDVDDPAIDKARGRITLPASVSWSGPHATYDLSDRRRRGRAYEQILREGAAADVRRYIDVDALIEVWDDLILPRAVSRAWIDWLAEHRGVVVRDCRERARQAGHPATGR